MIGTDEMSSSGMDISESFRPEDLSKADFFDFVSASDMDIGIGVGVGVGVSLHTHHQPQQQSQQHGPERNTARGMTHDGGGGGGGSGVTINNNSGNSNQSNNNNTTNNNNNNSNHQNNNHSLNGGSISSTTSASGDPTLQGYEFWHTDKDHTRLDSTIFEDLDRYCWQSQATPTASSTPLPTVTTTANSSTPPPQQHITASTANLPSQTSSPHLHLPPHQQHHHQQQQLLSPTSTHPTTAAATASVSASSSLSSAGSNSTVSTIDSSDGQIYTITVLNGSEPWLKREPEDNQLPTSLDLDSLLGAFPSYIKSEYPYDDSGFSTDGAVKESHNTHGSNNNSHGNSLNGVGIVENGLSISHLQQQQQQQQHSNMLSVLPSLMSPLAGSGGVVGNSNLCQQLAQFQNNNNDWHMTDHNADQNSAESLLRSALQGKGYAKNLHMQNGITLLPSSPTCKDDEMRRMLFPQDTDSLSFADSALNAAQIFEDTQTANNASHLHQHQQQHHHSHHQQQHSHQHSPAANSLMVDDMFLTLDNDFTADFEKIKRIANEVQQYCNATGSPTPTTASTPVDYMSSDVLMQLSPSIHSPGGVGGGGGVTTTTQQTLQHLQSAATQNGPVSTKLPTTLKADNIATSTTGGSTSSASRLGHTKSTKKYKRSTSNASSSNGSSVTLSLHNNNNNPNILNHNSTAAGTVVGAGATSSSSSSSTSSSNSPPTSCNSSTGSSNVNGSSSASGSSQRKERSLHYCSICSKGFKDKYSVNVHIRTHTGEKPFACSLCGKSFRQKAHLAKHYQTHMAQKNNGGGIVKGGSGSGGASKHRQSAAATTVNTVGSAASLQQQRHLQQVSSGISNVTNINVSLGSSSGPSSLVAGPGQALLTLSLGGPASANVLPPANGLLANR